MPVVSTTVALAVGVANLSRQYGAYGIAGFLHRADIAKVSVCVCLWLCKMHKHGKHTRLVRVHGISASSFVALFFMLAIHTMCGVCYFVRLRPQGGVGAALAGGRGALAGLVGLRRRRGTVLHDRLPVKACRNRAMRGAPTSSPSNA